MYCLFLLIFFYIKCKQEEDETLGAIKYACIVPLPGMWSIQISQLLIVGTIEHVRTPTQVVKILLGMTVKYSIIYSKQLCYIK